MKYDINKMVIEQGINEELDKLNENPDLKGKPIVGVPPIKGKLEERDKVLTPPIYDTYVDRRVGVDAATEYLDYRESRGPFTQFHVLFFFVFLIIASVTGFTFGSFYGEKNATSSSYQGSNPQSNPQTSFKAP